MIGSAGESAEDRRRPPRIFFFHRRTHHAIMGRRNKQMLTLTTKKTHNRTEFFDTDGLHVATITEQAKPRGKSPGLYQWVTRFTGNHVGYFEDAEDEIRTELER